MAENVKHHIQEEEKEMLPQAKKVMKDQLEALGEQMQKMKDQMKKEMSKAGSR
jgi:hemerythrin-like domain-containing protein